MGAFGVIGAIGQRLHEKNLLDLQDKANTHSAMLKMAQQLADNTGADPQVAQHYHNLAFQIASTPTMKFDAKKFDLQGPMLEYQRRQQAQPKPQAPTLAPAEPPPRMQQSEPQFSLPTQGPASRATDQPQGNPQTIAPIAGPPPAPPGQQSVPTAQLAVGGTAPFLGSPDEWQAVDPRRAMNLKLGEEQERYKAQYGAQYDAMGKERRALSDFQKQQINQDIKELQGEIDPVTKKSVWDSLTPAERAEIKTGRNLAGTSAAMNRPITLAGVTSNKEILAIDPNAAYVNDDGTVVPLPADGFSKTQIVAGQRRYSPTSPSQPVMMNDKSQAVLGNRYGAPGQVLEGIVPPPLAIPKPYDLQGGGKGIASAAQIAAGQAPTAIPGALGVGDPTTSVQHTPGLPDTVTSTRKGAGPSGGGGGRAQGARGAAVPSDSFPAAVKMTAEQVAKGELPLPADARTAGAVKQYLAEHNQEIPIPLAPPFQKLISEIDPRLKSIRGLKARLEKAKNDDRRGYFTKARIQYKTGAAGGDGQLANDIAELSFTGLQSAGQLIKGMSRAHNVLEKGLEHTPNVWIDSPKLIYEKLTQLEDRLKEARTSAMEDGRKTGVVPPPPGQDSDAKKDPLGIR